MFGLQFNSNNSNSQYTCLVKYSATGHTGSGWRNFIKSCYFPIVPVFPEHVCLYVYHLESPDQTKAGSSVAGRFTSAGATLPFPWSRALNLSRAVSSKQFHFQSIFQVFWWLYNYEVIVYSNHALIEERDQCYSKPSGLSVR